MATFQISANGEDFEIEAPSEEAAMAAFRKMKTGGGRAAAKPTDPAGDMSVNNVGRAAAEGVPIIGGALNAANAATNATLAPLIEPFLSPDPKNDLSRDGKSWTERYRKSLGLQNKQSKAFEEQNPVTSTLANVGGAVAGLATGASVIPGAARVMGMTGPLKQAVPLGAASGAAIEGVDAAVRGNDPVTGAAIGFGTGAVGPYIGHGAGKLYDRFTSKAAQPVQRTIDVNGRPLPATESMVTGNADAAAQEALARKGALGPEAQGIAETGDAQRAAEMRGAREDVAIDINGGMGPTRPVIPAEAAAAISSDLVETETQRAAREAARLQAAATEGTALRDSIAPPAANVVAGLDEIGEAIGQRAQAGRQARTDAYGRIPEVEGEFSPAAFQRSSNGIRQRLAALDDPLSVDPSMTQSNAALNIIDTQLANMPGPNAARAGGDLIPGPDGRLIPRPITARAVEQVRKQLIRRARAANKEAQGQGNSGEDAYAMGHILDAFDDHVTEAVRAGAFSGDGAEMLTRLRAARQAHADYKRTFSPRNGSDEVGKAVEKIIGKNGNAAASPDEIAKIIYGSADKPGGGKKADILIRLRDILGPDSPEWKRVQRGMLDHMFDVPEGAAALTADQMATRMRNLLGSKEGMPVAEVLFTPEQRARMYRHADQVVAARDASPEGIEKTIARWSGRDGGEPASPGEIVGTLFSGSKGVDKIAQAVKDRVEPASWNMVRAAFFDKLTEGAEGAAKFESARIAKNIGTFLKENRALAEVLFTEKEIKAMQGLANAYRQITPIPGSTNPSNTADHNRRNMQKVISGLRTTLLPLVGFMHGGVMGAAAGAAANPAVEKALAWTANKAGKKEAERRFIGETGPRISSGAGAASGQRRGAFIGQVAPAILQ